MDPGCNPFCQEEGLLWVNRESELPDLDTK